MPYRAGLIGCGMIGSAFADDPLMVGDVFTHAEAYTRCPETELAAVCDTHAERLETCGRRWNVDARFSSAKELAETGGLDLASVCTPRDTHYEVVRTLLTQGRGLKGILCEKPLASTVEQAQELVRLAEDRGVVLAVVYMRRYADNIRALKAFLDEGHLGRVQAVGGWYTKGVLNNGSHWFDLLRYLVGEVEWVTGWKAVPHDEDDPTLDVMLGLQGGILASLRACDGAQFTVFEMDVVGTKGRARLLDSCHRIDLDLVSASPRYSGYRELVPAKTEFGNRRNLLLHAVGDLADAVTTGRKPACTGIDGVAALAIGCAASLSARTGQRVALPRCPVSDRRGGS